MKRIKLFMAIFGLLTIGQFAFGQSGSTFADPDSIVVLPFVAQGESTCGFGNTITSSNTPCAGNFMTGEEKIYSFTPAVNMSNIEVSITNISDNFSGLFIMDAASPSGACLGSLGDPTSNDRVISGLTLTGGTTYYIVVSSWASPLCIGSYDLSVIDQTCPAPDSLMASNITGTTADISWLEMGLANSWAVEYGPVGFTPGTGTVVNTSTNPVSISNLTGATDYEFYVHALCSSADSSMTGPGTFTTLCLPILAPSTESFDVATLPNCWSNYATTGGPWTFTGTPGYGAASAQDHTGNNGEFIWMDFSNTDVAVVLETPEYDVSALTSPYFEYYFYTNNTNNNSINDLYFEAWDGSAWVTIDVVQQNIGGWAQFGYNVTSFTYGANLFKGRFRAESGGSTTDYYQDFLLDDISIIETPPCPDPSALMAAAVGLSADLSWLENGTATTWEIEYGAPGFVQGSVPGNILPATSNPFTLNGLTVTTNYEYYVRSLCSGGTYTAWVGPFSFTTTALCPAPTGLDAIVNGNTADLYWNQVGTANTWEYEYGPNGFSLGSGTGATVNVDSAAITALAYSTDYSFYVRTICGGGDSSTWSGPFNFTTPCAVNVPYYSQAFNTWTPSCWEQAGDGDQASGPTGIGNSSWGADNYMGVPTVSVNLWVANKQEWALSPYFDLSAGNYEMSIDLALAGFSSTNFSLMGSDDSVKIMYTEDDINWQVVTSFGQSDSLMPTLSTFVFPLTSTGNNVKFAIWGSEGTVNDPEDTEVYFTNFIIRTPPTCPIPSDLAINGLSDTTASIAWTENGSATLWEVQYDSVGFTLGMGNMDTTSFNPFSISGLMPATEYDVYVRAICGPSDSSVWLGPLTFYTGYCTPSPSSVDGQGIVNVTMDTLNNTTGAEPGNYGDYSHMIALGAQTSTLPISVTLQTGFTYDLWAWVDWNNDLDFDDAGEANYLGNSSNVNPTTFVGSISIPLSASLGNHRIRIGGADFGLGNTPPSQPCYTGSWAAFEDYTLMVTPAPSCIGVDSLMTFNTTASSVDVSWVDYNGATSWEYEYGPTGFVPGTGTIDTTNSNPFTLNGLNASSNYSINVRAICAVGDTSAWFVQSSFATECASVMAPYTQSFDVPTLPICWSNGAITGGPWVFTGTPGYGASLAQDHTGNGGEFIWMDFSSNDDSVSLTTLEVDVTNLNVPFLEFWFYTNNTNDNSINDLYVEAWDGTSWVLIDLIQQNLGGWVKFEYPLAAYTYGTNLVQIQFRAESGGSSSDYYQDFLLDDISVLEGPTCPRPTSLTAANITSTSFDFGWTESGSSTLWEIEYGTPGFAVGTGTNLGVVNSNPYTVTNLAPNTSYEFYVRADCGGGDLSLWEGPFLVNIPFANDLAVIDVYVSSGGCGLGFDTVHATVVNVGGSDQSNFEMGLLVNNNAISLTNVNTTIVSSDTMMYTYTALVNFDSASTYLLTAYSVLLNDSNVLNDTISNSIVKTLLVDSYPYFEDFATGQNGWSIDNTQNGSWAFGNPNKATINGAASDTNAFVTSLTGTYNTNELSYVTGPCFDLSTVNNPYVQMDVWWESQSTWDGAQLQFSTDGGSNWATLGTTGDGINWYNQNAFIGGFPSNTVWTGVGNAGSNGWKLATIEADTLAGQPIVNLRVAFGSDGFNTDDGFAFDNFAIFEMETIGEDTVLCETDTMIINADPSFTYLWNGESDDDSLVVDATILPEGNDTVDVIISGPGGFKMYDTLIVTVEIPVITLGSDTILCFGESMTIDAGAGFASYLWNDNSTMQTITTDGSSPGIYTYYVVGTSVNNCLATDSVDVNVNTEVIVNLGYDTNFYDSILQDVEYTLNAGPGFASYLWSDGSTNQTLLTNSQNDGQFSVTVTNVDGCPGSDTVIVDFNLAVGDLETSTISMFPNPTTDVINISVSNASALGEVNIKILDITGKVVLTENLKGSSAVFNETYDVSRLATGTYFVQFEAQGEVVTRQFVIK